MAAEAPGVAAEAPGVAGGVGVVAAVVSVEEMEAGTDIVAGVALMGAETVVDVVAVEAAPEAEEGA